MNHIKTHPIFYTSIISILAWVITGIIAQSYFELDNDTIIILSVMCLIHYIAGSINTFIKILGDI